MTIDSAFIYMLVRLSLGALAAFLAIFSLPRIRDAAWLFFILGTIFLYLQTIFDLLAKLKIIIEDNLIFWGISFWEPLTLFLAVLPFLSFALAFLIMLIKR